MSASVWHHVYWIIFWLSAGASGVWLLLRVGYTPSKKYRVVCDQRNRSWTEVLALKDEYASLISAHAVLQRSYDRIRGDLQAAAAAFEELELINNELDTARTALQSTVNMLTTNLRAANHQLTEAEERWEARNGTTIGKRDAIATLEQIRLATTGDQ